MIFGAILAGGVGSRMNIADMPKQFLPLGEKPIIVHTIEKFLLNDKFDKIYVGVHADWLLHMSDLLKKYSLTDDRIELVRGGKDRTESILNIIKKIENDESLSLSDNDIIVTHDSVRPFVTSRIIDENISMALKFEYSPLTSLTGTFFKTQTLQASVRVFFSSLVNSSYNFLINFKLKL